MADRNGGDQNGRRHRDDRRQRTERSRSRSRSRSRRYHSRSRSRSIDRYRSRRDDRYSSRHSSSRSYRDSRSPRRRHDDESDRRRNRRSRSRSRDKRRDSRDRNHSEKQHNKREDRSTQVTSKSDYSKNGSGKNTVNASHDNSSDSHKQSGHLDSLPLPDSKNSFENSDNSNTFDFDFDPDNPIEKARIHRQMEQKLREALAKEGKVYPPPKPEASHPVFANDGSFLEIFKKMQEAQNSSVVPSNLNRVGGMGVPNILPAMSPAAAQTSVATPIAVAKPQPPPVLPVMARRRGGKILKTGIVEKPKTQNGPGANSKDFWALYLAEVNKYKSHGCESSTGARPLMK